MLRSQNSIGPTYRQPYCLKVVYVEGGDEAGNIR
jgi:hypothetical protein